MHVRLVALFASFALASLGCSSLDDSPDALDVRAPDLDCSGCFVVNAALAVTGTSVFVGSYAGLQERAILRRLAGGKWSTLLDSERHGAMRQLWSTDRDLYFQAGDGVQHMDLESLESEPIEVQGNVVWSAAPDDIVVFDHGVAHVYDGQGWHDQTAALGVPVAVTGQARSELYVLDADGVIAHAQGESFVRLTEQPSFDGERYLDHG